MNSTQINSLNVNLSQVWQNSQTNRTGNMRLETFILKALAGCSCTRSGVFDAPSSPAVESDQSDPAGRGASTTTLKTQRCKFNILIVLNFRSEMFWSLLALRAPEVWTICLRRQTAFTNLSIVSAKSAACGNKQSKTIFCTIKGQTSVRQQ